MQIAGKLKKLRKDKKITQKEMAKFLGYKSKSGYCQLENGKVRMTLDKAKKISEILNVDIKEIFFDDEVKNLEQNTKTQRLHEEVRGMEKSMKGENNKINILSDLYTKLVVETDEDNPVTIAVITDTDVIPADGYRVRLTPKYD